VTSVPQGGVAPLPCERRHSAGMLMRDTLNVHGTCWMTGRVLSRGAFARSAPAPPRGSRAGMRPPIRPLLAWPQDCREAARHPLIQRPSPTHGSAACARRSDGARLDCRSGLNREVAAHVFVRKRRRRIFALVVFGMAAPASSMRRVACGEDSLLPAYLKALAHPSAFSASSGCVGPLFFGPTKPGQDESCCAATDGVHRPPPREPQPARASAPRALQGTASDQPRAPGPARGAESRSRDFGRRPAPDSGASASPAGRPLVPARRAGATRRVNNPG
jgi:hypothetical protein